jgi:PPE-repeat protein
MPNHPWGASTPEMNAGVLETGSSAATWMAASAAWMGLASATMATIGITGGQMAASLESISGVRSAVQTAATPPYLAWLTTLAGIAFKQAAITAVVAESYGMARTTMIPSEQSINNRVREMAAEATNFFGQNTPLIGELNAEYGEYTIQNATIGNTYGEVITAATLPVPIPPPPPLSNAAQAAADSSEALAHGAQMASRAGSGELTQGASKAASSVGSGGSSELSSMLSAPMQALQSAGQSLSSAPQSFGQLLQAPSQLFGSASGLGDLLGGGSTANSFSPALAGAGGLPLGGAGLHSGAGSGLGGVGGLGGGLSNALAARPGSSTSSNSRTSVLSGISTSPVQEKLAGATTTAGPGGAMGPGAAGLGAGSGGRSRRSDAVMVAYPDDDGSPRRGAQDTERDLFN